MERRSTANESPRSSPSSARGSASGQWHVRRSASFRASAGRSRAGSPTWGRRRSGRQQRPISRKAARARSPTRPMPSGPGPSLPAHERRATAAGSRGTGNRGGRRLVRVPGGHQGRAGVRPLSRDRAVGVGSTQPAPAGRQAKANPASPSRRVAGSAGTPATLNGHAQGEPSPDRASGIPRSQQMRFVADTLNSPALRRAGGGVRPKGDSHRAILSQEEHRGGGARRGGRSRGARGDLGVPGGRTG